MKAFRVAFCFMLCLILISAFSAPLFALSNRPPRSQYEGHGSSAPDPFAEADALRYGGLFGPLPEPDWKELDMIPEQYINPWAYFFAAMEDYDYGYGWGNSGSGFYRSLSARDMGFAIDENHFIPIVRTRS